ncbi:hypothetical protein Tco_0542999 [Tanacetum coccineum]
MPCNSHCISPGYTITISLILVLPLGAVLPEVAWSPTLKANDGIGICPLGSRVVVVIVIAVVVVICSCRPAPTVLGQVAKLLAEPEQAPPSPIYIPYVPEPDYPKFLPVDDEVFLAEEQPMPADDLPTHQSPGYIPESDPEEDPEEDDEEDPEEDPADYPADRGDRDDEESSDDDDDAEEEHLAPADPAAVAYSADQDPYLAYRVTARMSIRPQAPAPFLSEEVAERLLALPTPPPSPLSPYSSPLPQIPSPPLPIPPPPPPNGPTYVEGSLGSRAAGIRQRDALPSPVHETGCLKLFYHFRKRKPCRNTLVPGYEVGRSSTAVASRQIHGITSMSHPGRLHRPHLEGSIKVIELTTTVDQEDEIIYSQLDDARRGPDLSRAAWATFERMLAINTFRGHTLWTTVIGSSVLDHVIAGSRPVKETDGDFGSAKSRPSETETVSGGTKDSEEPQDSDDRATETEGTC